MECQRTGKADASHNLVFLHSLDVLNIRADGAGAAALAKATEWALSWELDSFGNSKQGSIYTTLFPHVYIVFLQRIS